MRKILNKLFNKFSIGGAARPYLIRWFIVPRNRHLNIFIHCFCRDDDDRALHDHPWNFVSIMVWGSYREHFDDRSIVRSAPSIAFRKATCKHRVELINNKPCWTLVVTGKRLRTWGFHCPNGWVRWREFIMRGCEGKPTPETDVIEFDDERIKQ